MKKILVTAFDAFANNSINPSSIILDMIDYNNDFKIIKLKIPTVYKKSANMIREYIDKYMPDYILMLGLASNRDSISIERIGINIDDFSISDNENNMPIDKPIFIDGQNAYFSNLDIKLINKNINDSNIKSIISNTAGTYVCNHVLYSVLYFIDKYYNNIKAGFIHIPCIKEQVKENNPYMELDDSFKAINIAIKTIIDNM